jgi:hypothetical protein
MLRQEKRREDSPQRHSVEYNGTQRKEERNVQAIVTF